MLYQLGYLVYKYLIIITIITATHDLKMIDVSDRIFWIRDGKVDRIETRAEVAVGAVE